MWSRIEALKELAGDSPVVRLNFKLWKEEWQTEFDPERKEMPGKLSFIKSFLFNFLQFIFRLESFVVKKFQLKTFGLESTRIIHDLKFTWIIVNPMPRCIIWISDSEKYSGST